jgi:hypothetical protein
MLGRTISYTSAPVTEIRFGDRFVSVIVRDCSPGSGFGLAFHDVLLGLELSHDTLSRVEPNVVPPPAAGGLLLAGVAAIGALRRCRAA